MTEQSNLENCVKELEAKFSKLQYYQNIIGISVIILGITNIILGIAIFAMAS